MKKTVENVGSNGPAFDRRKLIIGGVNVLALSAAGYSLYKIGKYKDGIRKILEAHNIPRSSPNSISADPALRAMIQENFDVIAGNASFEDAKIVGVGEMHHYFSDQSEENKEHQKKSLNGLSRNIAFFEKTAKDKDHILVEGEDHTVAERKISKTMVMKYPWMAGIYKKDILVSGWDDGATYKNTPVLPLRESAMLRNERGMIPALIERARTRQGKIFMMCGVAHLMDDPRVDAALEKEKIPYLLLGEKNSVAFAREEAKRM